MRRLAIIAFAASLVLITLLYPGSVSPADHLEASPTPAARLYLPLVLRLPPPYVADVVFEFSQVVSTPEDARARAVAFHAIDFIDADANTLSTLTFGTPETDALQGEGWYANETCPDVGTCQWAGGASKRATMRLTIPAAAEGMLLNVSGVQNSIWMTVTVESLQTVLQVDGLLWGGWRYWHQGYVPLAAGVPAPPSTAEPEWFEGRAWPHFPQASRLYAILAYHELYDLPFSTSVNFRINQSYNLMNDLTLAGMQGVINRHTPSVYLKWWPAPGGRLYHRWAEELSRYVPMVNLDLDGLSAINFLYRRFAGRFRGAVIYDPQVPDTINLATMIAGLEDRLILAPEQLAMPGIPAFSDVVDLRPLAAAQGWDATEEGKYRLYQWVYENLWPRLDHRIIGVISPGPPTSRYPVEDPTSYLRLELSNRDYLVALRLPVLWLSPREEPQRSLFAQFLAEAPSPIPVYGVFAVDEDDTTTLVSQHGDWIAGLSNAVGCTNAGNLTIFSAVRPAPLAYQAEIDPARILATLGTAPVVTVYSSDGDAIDMHINRGDPGFKNWVWDRLQGHRFGWTMNATLPELAPVIWNWFMETRDGVSFVGGVSGAGYVNPAFMDDAHLEAYLRHTDRYFREMGLRSTEISEYGGHLSEATAQRYYQALHDGGFLGFLTSGSWGAPLNFEYASVPAPIARSPYILDGSNWQQILAEILAGKPSEFFGDPVANGQHGGEIVADANARGGQAVAFYRAKVPGCCLVVGGPDWTLAPGTYTLTYRLKVPANQETAPIAQLYAWVQAGDGHNLAHRFIAPADFLQAGQYQDFSLAFTLDRFTEHVEFRVDYYGGLGDGCGLGQCAVTDPLYLDEILAVRQGGAALPIFTPLWLGVTNWVDNSKALNLLDELEANGGVVLHPDEFLAALNPEYMIALAEPILGAGHPALAQARAYLTEGAYLDSLYTVREALKATRRR